MGMKTQFWTGASKCWNGLFIEGDSEFHSSWEKLIRYRILGQTLSWYHGVSNICVEQRDGNLCVLCNTSGLNCSWWVSVRIQNCVCISVRCLVKQGRTTHEAWKLPRWMLSLVLKIKLNALFRAKQDLGEWICWDFWNCGLWMDGIQLLFVKIKIFLSRLCKLSWPC